MKKLLFLSLTFLILSSTFAQNDSTNYKNSLGVSAGRSTGLGFSYRHWPNKVGVQFTGVPIFSTNEVLVSAGFSGLLKFKEFSPVTMYGYWGNHFYFDERFHKTNSTDPITGLTVTKKYILSSQRLYTTAIGAGFKVDLWKVIQFNLQAGYGVDFYLNSKHFKSTIVGEIGLYYQF
jgi:hypothetical protein